jgi:hypothetical protein
MRRVLTLCLAATVGFATAQAVPASTFKLSLTSFGNGYSLVSRTVLPAKFPKPKRALVSRFVCGFGALRFLRPLDEPLPLGDQDDQNTFAAKTYVDDQFNHAELSAHCVEGRLVVTAKSAAALLRAFEPVQMDDATMQDLTAVNQYPDLMMKPSALLFMGVQFDLSGNSLKATPGEPAWSAGVSQGGAVKSLYLSGKSEPVQVNPSKPYTLHVIQGVGHPWFNLTVAATSLTLWQSQEQPALR